MFKILIKKKATTFLKSSFNTPKSIFLFGLFFAFAITLKEVNSSSYNNFLIILYSTFDFWHGVNPYADWFHLDLKGRPLGVFIYLPLFNLLFTPFTIFPTWLGAFLWNFFTYSLFYKSIFNLPKKYNFKNKKFIFFITCLLLFATMLSMQFNPIVAAIFLFSYTALEKKNYFLAVLLISISGLTKVYGIIQFSMFLFYPRFWKNALYSIITFLTLLAVPLIRYTPSEYIDLVISWKEAISFHSTKQGGFYSIYRPFFEINDSIGKYSTIISASIFLLLILMIIINLKKFKNSFEKRAQYLGILMSWAILFSLGTELHTYVIAMTGYAIWYINIKTTKIDKVLLWINFFLLSIFPIDILCPVFISKVVLGDLNLGIIMFSITWFIMVYKTFLINPKKEEIESYLPE